MSGLVPDFGRLQTKVNQSFILGNPTPPDMSQMDAQILKAASPRLLNLVDTRTDQNISDAVAKSCRTHKGIGDLRKLQIAQEDHTYYQPGCGWLFYHPQGATNPTINRAAFGDSIGPVYGGLGQADEVRSGMTYTKDLEKAEKNLSMAFAQRLNNNCQSLESLTKENKEYFGFCKTSRRIIPIETVNGLVKARYPKDIQLGCAAENIMLASSSPGGCPSQEGVSSGDSQRQGTNASGSAQKEWFILAAAGSAQKEWFISAAAGCTLPLTKSCLIKFTRESGCTDKGSLLQSLKSSTVDENYDTSLRTNEAYKYYTGKGKLVPALFRDGSVASKQVAIEELNRLASQAMETPSEANKGSAAAARDLCIQKDYFLETYDFCSEVTPESRVNTENYPCVKKIWRQSGGDTHGKLFPTLANFSGKTFGQLTQLIESLKKDLQSTDKTTQANAISNFIGTETYVQADLNALDRTADLRGAETVWIYYENWQTEGAIPVIMRCDTLQQNNVGAKILPDIGDNFAEKYMMPSNQGVAIMTAFEIRPDTDIETNFKILTDDGFTLGYNQMPGQGINNNNDFNTFIYQPPTWRQSGKYTLKKDSKDTRNMFGIKWFQGPGGASFLLQRNGKTITSTPQEGNDIYLTQEPLAPWLQFEICSRPNLGRTASVGFFEKRWNGPCAFPWQLGTKWSLQDQKPVPSFDAESSQVSFTTNVRLLGDLPIRGFMGFTANSWWRTKANFAFNSMRCLTLLVRPRATLSAGGMGSIMWWPGYFRGWSSIGMETPGLWLYSPDGKTYQFDFWIGNRGHSYMDCKIDDWNLVVIHVIGNASTGVENFACASAPLESLRTAQGRSAFSSRLNQMKSGTGNIIIPNIRNPNERGYSGPIILGGGNANGNTIQRYAFTGDIAWIHGFNNYMNSDMLEAEVFQTWKSRWPISPLSTPDRPHPHQNTIRTQSFQPPATATAAAAAAAAAAVKSRMFKW